jgi:hypothetical protein
MVLKDFESDLFAENTHWLDDVYAIYIELHDWHFPGMMKTKNFQSAIATQEFEIFICGKHLLYVRV